MSEDLAGHTLEWQRARTPEENSAAIDRSQALVLAEEDRELQCRKIDPVPVVLYGREFWQGAIDWQHFVDEGTIQPRDLDLFQYADSPREAWEILCAFHDMDPDGVASESGSGLAESAS